MRAKLSSSATAIPAVATAPRERPPALWRRVLRAPTAGVGLVTLALYLAIALLAPQVAPFDPTQMNTGQRLASPSLSNLFGTDQFGRDIFSRILYGTRVSLVVSVLAVAVALGIGVTLGIIAGYAGGWIDNLAMRGMDVLFAFPAMLLALAIVAVLGQNLLNIVLAIGIVYVPQFARVARGAVLSIKELEFFEAARALGTPRGWVLRRHILPNIVAPLIVQTSLSLSLAVLVESALSFLGLGTQPPYPSLGNMLGEGRRLMALAPWTVIFPGGVLMGLILGFNFLGDGLQEVLDPRLRLGKER